MLIKTGSRGGFIALIVLAVYVLIAYKSIPPVLRIGAVVGGFLVLSVIGSAAYWNMMRSILHPADDYNMTQPTGRKAVWKRGIGYMLQRPVLGVGAGAFPQAEGMMSDDIEGVLGARRRLEMVDCAQFVRPCWCRARCGWLSCVYDDDRRSFWMLARVRTAPTHANLVKADDIGSHGCSWGRCWRFALRVFSVSAAYFSYLYVILVLSSRNRPSAASLRSAAIHTFLRTSPSLSDSTCTSEGDRSQFSLVSERVTTLDSSEGVVEAGMVAGGAAHWSRRRNASKVLVLAYHDIVPSGELIKGDRSLHLPQEEFAGHLDELARTHDIVSLSAALRPTTDATRPRAVITFDDAYRGALTAGVAELRSRRLPATIFISPSFVGGGTFWWDRVADDDEGLDAAFRQAALTEARGVTESVVAIASQTGMALSSAPDYALCASQEELSRALQHDGITFGAHTWTHPNLLRMTGDELRSEMVRPLEWLRAVWRARASGDFLSVRLSRRARVECSVRCGIRRGLHDRRRLDGTEKVEPLCHSATQRSSWRVATWIRSARVWLVAPIAVRPRTRRNILVTDGEQRAALAIVRSLGAVGHTVHVCSKRGHSLAGASKWARRDRVVADPLTAPDAFLADVARLVRDYAIDMIIPVAEPSLLTLLPARESFDDVIIPFPDAATFSRICDKQLVLSAAPSVGIAVPSQTVLNDPSCAVRMDLDALHYPVVVKPARSVGGEVGHRVKAIATHAATPLELRAALSKIDPRAYPLLLQQRVVGPGIGVFLLIWNGEVIAEFSHFRLREQPPAGGISVYRSSIALDPGLARKIYQAPQRVRLGRSRDDRVQTRCKDRYAVPHGDQRPILGLASARHRLRGRFPAASRRSRDWPPS